MSLGRFVGSVKAFLLPYYLTLHNNCSFSKKIRFLKYAKLAKKNGVAFFRIDRVASELLEAYYAVTNMSEEDKSFYIRQGYNPNREAWFGMSKNNYKDYLSLFDFYSSKNYRNSELVSLFDNKLSTYYLLQPFKDSIPYHYFYIEKGAIYPLQVSDKHNYNADDVISLIDKKAIVFKKCHGGHGAGFLMAERIDNIYYVNRKNVSHIELKKLIENLDDYIVTDYIRPAKEIRKIVGEDAYAVMRVLTIYNEEDGPQVIAMMVRLGSKKAGLTQAEHDYTYVGVDMETGRLFDPIYEISDYEFRHITKHPDTNEQIDGAFIPNVSSLTNLVKSISGYIPMTPYLCFDIIPTDSGFSILEINSHGQAFTVEPYYKVKNNIYFKKVVKSIH